MSRWNVWDLSPMTDAGILQQPPEVWRDVERQCLAGWGGKVRQMLGLDWSRGGFHPPIEPGWLTWETMPKMEAWGVPIRQWFTACVLSMRSTEWPPPPLT